MVCRVPVQKQEVPVAELIDLTPYLDKTKIDCLNVLPDFPIQNALFDKGDSTYAKSDCDPQLVISIGFNTTVKLQHIKFRSPKVAERPKIVKIFLNQVQMDFDSCENDQATQEFELKDNDFKDKTEVKFVKFQQVKTLTVFIQEANNADQTMLSQLVFYGYPCQEMDDEELDEAGLHSLVKYGNPVLVSTSGKKGKDDKKGKDKKTLEQQHTEDILNSILPPREYTMDKQQLWIQSVLPTPATKQDVLQLQEQLDNQLQQRQARETGICPIREELYAQCFDELIRQITIGCSERGLLLVRVRDEIRMTIQAYQTLYESSIAYGMRKTLQAEQYKAEMQKKIQTLDQENNDLTNEVKTLETKIDDIENNDKENQKQQEKLHKDKVDFHKKTNQRFKEELERLLAGPQAQAQMAKEKKEEQDKKKKKDD